MLVISLVLIPKNVPFLLLLNIFSSLNAFVLNHWMHAFP